MVRVVDIDLSTRRTVITSGRPGEGLPPSRAIGFSVTSSMFDDFEDDPRIDSANWELLWEPGASLTFWSDPNFEGWSNSPVSPIASFSLVTMNCAQATSQQSTLVPLLEDVIQVIRDKYGSGIPIALMPQVSGYQNDGGHGDPVCQVDGTNVRDAVHHAAMYEAIGTVIASGSNLARGADIHLTDCSGFDDTIGHLTPAGQVDAATQWADWVEAQG